MLVLFLFLGLMGSFWGCSGGSAGHWSEFVPDSALFLIVPEENSTIRDILEAPYIPMFDDITPSAIQITGNVGEAAAGEAITEAVILYPDTSNDWQPIWVIRPVQGLMSYMKENHQREFAQNNYSFGNFTVEKFFISDREIFAVDVGNYILFSESSLGIENSLRTLRGSNPAMELSEEQTQHGRFIVNTPSLDRWMMQLAQITHIPDLRNRFDGGKPIAFSLDNREEEWQWKLSGKLNLDESPSALLRAVRSAPGEFTLDRYISTNAATFSIFQLEPRSVPPNGDAEHEFELDQYLDENPDIWQDIAAALNPEAAFVTFAESGAESTSEYMFIRHLSSASNLRSLLANLTSFDDVNRDGNTFMIQSRSLGKLIGSELNPMVSFHLTIVDDAAVMAQRRGLAEGVSGDVSRRGVMYYNDDYMMIRDDHPADLSSLTYVNAQQFGTYVQPWLYPQNYLDALVSNLDLFVMTTRASDDGRSADVDITSYQREVTDDPYRERWVFPVSSGEITGTPVMADITSSSRDEVIFSTDAGYVYVLATDGTEVLELETGGEQPIGAPVVYDWYGNNQNVILQAAGNSIYAWNMNGTILPNFPITLNETITTPLTIEDVTRNGIAEIVVGTADRNLHILNSRGRPVSGWPQSVNTVITTKPLLATLDGERSIFAISENALHGWSLNGQIRNGYPVFLDTPLHGSPAVYEDHLLGAGRNGSLYSIGSAPLFSDTLSTFISEDSLYIQQLQISSDGLNSTPSVRDVLLRDDEGFYRNDLIAVQSRNGSLFLYNPDGELKFTRSLGQPASGDTAPMIIDVNRDQRMDLVGLADFGRLYAWNIITEQRLYDLPTTGMRYPLIADLYRDGNNEIIAFTRDGLRCWTILRTSTSQGG
ncbi:VCBS repeat-containing protein [Rhodohalobacter sp. SW132]|nr:VCBS repeat-containing protein [Rhodohalobacter sp. SW132]